MRVVEDHFQVSSATSQCVGPNCQVSSWERECQFYPSVRIVISWCVLFIRSNLFPIRISLRGLYGYRGPIPAVSTFHKY